MELEVYAGSEGLSGLKTSWEALEARPDVHIFQTFAYAELWQKTVGEPSGAVPLIAVLREGGTVVGIFPACRVLLGGIPILTWLGGPTLLDYGDVLFDAAACSTPIGEFIDQALVLLRKHGWGSLLYLTNVRDDAQAIAALRERLRVYKKSAAPYVEIAGDYDAYLLSIGKNMRHEVRRRSRRLAEAGRVEYRLLAPGDPDIASAMRRLIALQQARFSGGLGHTATQDRLHAAFRMEQAMHDPHSRVAVLSLDGALVAASLHIVYRGRMYCLMPAFDAQYAQYSPSLLLKARVLQTCFEEGLNPCDFCWGDEAYKYVWTKVDVPMTSFVSAGTEGALVLAVAGIARRIARSKQSASVGKPEQPTSQL